MKILVALVLVAFLAGCTSSGRSATSFGPILCAADGQPVVGAFVRHGAAEEKPPMSMGKKIAIGAVAAGAVYAAGEEWIWGGKGGRHTDTVPTVNDTGDGNVEIYNHEGGEQTVVVCNDCTIEGTVN